MKIGSCAGVVGAMSLSWMAMADAQKLKFPRALTFKDILESTKVTEIVAARDRESFAVPWRRVMLKKVDESTWLLLDENGTVLDEPDDSCPCKGFSQYSLFEEAGMDYYEFPFDEVETADQAPPDQMR